MARGLHRLDAGYRHARRPDLGEVRRASLTMAIMLVAQYGLGRIVQASAAGPFTMTVQALLSLALIVIAVALLARALRSEQRPLVMLAAVALGAIAAAFAAGLVRDDGRAAASSTVAILTGVALLSCVVMLALSSVQGRDPEFDRDFADDDPDDFTPWTPSGPPRTSLIYTEDPWG